MFWNLFANENTKNLRRSMLWIELGLMALLVILINVVLFAVLQMNPGGEAATQQAQAGLHDSITWPGSLLQSISLAGGGAFGGILLVILVGAVTAQEYVWRTLHLWLSRGVHRPLLLAAKFTALFIPTLLIVLIPLLVGGAVTIFTSIWMDGSVAVERVDFLQVVLSLLRTAFTLLPYAGLTFLLAITTRSAVVAIGGALGYTLLIEGILMQVLVLLGGQLGKLGNYLPGGLAQSLLSLNRAVTETPAALPAEMLSPAAAAAGIALWTLAFLGLSLWAFQRQDLAE